MGAPGGTQRGIGGLLSLVYFQEYVGDGPCAFPLDHHREQFAIDIHGPEPGLPAVTTCSSRRITRFPKMGTVAEVSFLNASGESGTSEARVRPAQCRACPRVAEACGGVTDGLWSP